MSNVLLRFLVFWGLNVLVLWVASELFSSIHFSSTSTMLVSGLLFGVAHAVLKPILGDDVDSAVAQGGDDAWVARGGSPF